MKEIFNFKDNNIEYSLLINNGNLVYQKNELGNISNHLLEDEKQLINNILISLIPSNNIKDFGMIKYLKKDIKYLYDVEKDFHIFLENDEVTKNCITLCNVFNDQKGYAASYWMKRGEKRNTKYTRRMIKVGDRVIKVLVTTAVVASSIFWVNGVVNVLAKLNYDHKVEKHNNTPINLFDIISAINSNSNLSSEEKDFLASHIDYFGDNLKYYDYYTVINNLKKLEIEYIPGNNNDGMYGKFSGNYIGNPKITIYNSTCFANAPKYAITHEFLHAFTKFITHENHVYEAINVLMNNEYFNDDNVVIYDSGYPSIRNYTYILAELIESDVLRKFHAENDNKYLVEALMKIIPDEDMAYQLLDYLNFISKTELLQNTDIKNYEALKEELKFKHKEVKNALKAYYETKYQIQVEDDLYAFYMFNPSVAATKIAAELEFEINAYRYADLYTKIKQFKKVFNKTGDDSLTLQMYNSVREMPKYYTKEELLGGNEEYYFSSEEEINLPLMDNGMYLGRIYEPLHSIDYIVLSQEELNKSESINK